MSTMVEQAKEKLVEASRALEVATRAEEAKKREIAEAEERVNVMYREREQLLDAKRAAETRVTATALTFATAEREAKPRPRPAPLDEDLEHGDGWRDIRDGEVVVVVKVRSGRRRLVRVVERGSGGCREVGDEYEINLDDTDGESSDPTQPYWRRSPAHDLPF